MDIDPQIDCDACGTIEGSFSVLSINSNGNAPLYPPLDNPPNLPQTLHKALLDIRSNDYQRELAGLINVRKLLSIVSHPPIQEVINTNISPELISMAYSRPKEFAFEVCWVLCNIGSGNGESTKYLIGINSLEFFNQIFDSDQNSFDLHDLIVWAVGNIAGESVCYRNIVLDSPICGKIIKYSEVLPSSLVSKFKNLTWTMNNLLKGNPRPWGEKVVAINQYLLKALLITDNEECLVSICWGLSYASEGYSDFEGYTQAVLERILSLYKHPNITVVVPSIRVLGNFISNCNQSWEMLSPLGLVDTILLMMKSEKLSIRRETIWIASNLCAETRDAVTAMINANIFTVAYNMIEHESEAVITEIIWMVVNTANCCSKPQAEEIYRIGWIQKLLKLFRSVQKNIKCLILEGLTSLFRVYPNWFDKDISQEIEKLAEADDFTNNVSRLKQELLNQIHEFQVRGQ